MPNRTHTDFIAIHCAATKPGVDVDVEDIRRWHVDGNKWADIGYHLVIKIDGTVQAGRPLDAIGAHVAGFNSRSVGVCLVGGLDANGKAANTFSDAQMDSLEATVRFLLRCYPGAKVQGHRDFPDVKKDCPSFDVATWFAARGM